MFFGAGVFAFDLYDLNADGKLTSAEVAQMFRELMGAKTLEQEAISRYSLIMCVFLSFLQLITTSLYLHDSQGVEQLVEVCGGERRFHHCGLLSHFHHCPPGLAAARVRDTEHAPYLNVGGKLLAENEQAAHRIATRSVGAAV